ncbi:hypothetical protein FM996_20430 [Methylosinus sporium]|uniref:Uncharacterized protein n=1 Tax=Methylosinus sporium TaxID=428 RepID=A0A549SD29_METSR|nr:MULTISPECIES: hypothetical protein [Methylosinus]TRL24672.1 hypothetical protein FM996_20430 [Methylosinus sporium]BBU63967.1 hypothetical protein MSC49_39020 [Methylosinus sp. C49]
MRDDDEPGSGNGMLWYAVGRSSGYSSGKSDGYREGEDTGYYEGEQAALRNLNVQQDAEYRAGWRSIHIKDFNAWMDLLNKERKRNAQLVAENESLRQSLANSDSHGEETSRKLLNTQKFKSGLEECLWSLLKAAEQGKAERPEYSELKSIVYQMIDAWSKGEILCRPDALGPRIAALWRALKT